MSTARNDDQARQDEGGKAPRQPSGKTLYVFEKDGRNKDVCAKLRGCLTVWPAVITEGKAGGR